MFWLGLEEAGGCLLSWHVFISKSCAVSGALLAAECSVSLVQFEMLIKQTRLRLSDNCLMNWSVAILASAQVGQLSRSEESEMKLLNQLNWGRNGELISGP